MRSAKQGNYLKAIETDRWTSSEVQDYKRLKDEFSVNNGVVLRKKRILIPPTLRSRAVELAHLGHQVIVKTKQLIREKVWFPGIDKLTEDKVKNYLSCQYLSPNVWLHSSVGRATHRQRGGHRFESR